MPRSTRKELTRKAECALRLCDNLDAYLMEMDVLADGRQPAIVKMRPIMVQGHEAVRSLWTALRRQL